MRPGKHLNVTLISGAPLGCLLGVPRFQKSMAHCVTGIGAHSAKRVLVTHLGDLECSLPTFGSNGARMGCNRERCVDVCSKLRVWRGPVNK